MKLNRKGLAFAAAVATLCAASAVTLITWPATDSITWEPLTPAAWWQFQWLAGLGFVLSALPSWVIYKFDAFFVANPYLKDAVSGVLLFVEIAAICFGVYKIVAAFDRHPARERARAA